MSAALLPIIVPDDDSSTLALQRDIAAYRDAGDYDSLEQVRRGLNDVIAELSILRDDAENAVIATLPPEGAVIDGRNTTVKPGSKTRKFDVGALVRRLVRDATGIDEPVGTDIGEAVAAILSVFPLGTPRMRAMDNHGVYWRDYLESEETGPPKVEVAK